MRTIHAILGAGLALVSAPAAAAPLGELATPPGITLEPLGISQGYELGKQTATFLPREKIVFADAGGKTLYTLDADPAGKSTCVDACAQDWKPAPVPKGAKAFGRWSQIKRADSTLQWALAGKALYTFTKDIDPGSVFGNSPARFGPQRRNSAGELVGGRPFGSPAPVDLPAVPGRTPAMAFPMTGLDMPADFAVKEVADAVGLVLVNHDAMTVYALDGRKEPGKSWQPVEAPQLSSAVGDFAFVVRADGIKQWTYKGRGLYTYALDLAPNDANGIGADKALDVAAVARYFLPANVTVQATLARGKVLATDKGQTLYRREAHIDQTGSGHNLRRGQPIRPAIGREIGLKNVRCDDVCRKQWHPYAAPAGAVAQGQWSVATHPDGFKQWVYQGYPLWTYDGDTKPGDMNGNDDSLYAFSGMAHAPSGVAPEALVDIGTPQDGGIGLYWLIASP